MTNSDPLFVSTRTENETYRFDSVALLGLAPDGGLYLPKPSRAISRKINLDRLVELDFMERNIRILEVIRINISRRNLIRLSKQ